MAASTAQGELGLSIIGLGTQYPPYTIPPSALDVISKKFYPDSPAYASFLAFPPFSSRAHKSPDIVNPTACERF